MVGAVDPVALVRRDDHRVRPRTGQRLLEQPPAGGRLLGGRGRRPGRRGDLDAAAPGEAVVVVVAAAAVGAVPLRRGRLRKNREEGWWRSFDQAGRGGSSSGPARD